MKQLHSVAGRCRKARSTPTAVARFLETGGAPPKGVTMLGRWHGMDGRGFAISESTDAKAMYQWVAQWADVLQLTVTPCVEDADAGAVMASAKALELHHCRPSHRIRFEKPPTRGFFFRASCTFDVACGTERTWPIRRSMSGFAGTAEVAFWVHEGSF